MNYSTVTAAHRCLRIGETLQVIINSLRDPDAKAPLAAVAALARTCKMLHEAVLPTLWRYQNSFKPLLRLLPSDSWSEILDEHGDSIFHIIDPSEIEWTRFDHYALHVRSIGHPETSKIALDTWRVLSDHRPGGQPLLPRLRALSLYEPGKIYLPFIHLFLAPTLIHLELASANFNQPAIMCQVFKHVGETCEQVEFLQLSVETIDDDDDDDNEDDEEDSTPQKLDSSISDALAQLLRGLPKLECYSGNSVATSASCIEALAALPKVELATLHVLPEEMDMLAVSTASRPRDGQWFNALRSISLHVDQMDKSTAAFFGAIQSEDLDCLLITSSIQPDSATTKRHLELVACPNLTTVRLALGHTFAGNPGSHTLDVGEVLQPLYAHPNISSLDIQCSSLIVSANAVRDIANAWRDLSSLQLVSIDLPLPVVDKPLLTLEGLIPLVVNCRWLDHLTLPVSADEVPDEAMLAQLLPKSSAWCILRELTVAYAPIENPDQVAYFLLRLFPELREVHYRDADEQLPYESEWGIFEDKWEEVQELLEWHWESDADEALRVE
ncbi:uncharacterized protein TRAVEDRAFT_50284 [Trametes versicolor FP-101664 SS1]|uniref:uncharacterized protein n=1 Tax=Trametes versicolor (strain FP-101664) TaxID=717944 RepID=UPI0004622D2A|nr:uncharacterized protein TRAVEDRAFT_50284 [Trametes versicolor FP-101664 SS1]EIW55801.1 hypothetical protein TRAVEDRAFT_50284 [Trametes versicolor FP-101664 SS1]